MDSRHRGAVAAPRAPRGVRGSIHVPPSKSLTQRALVAAAVAPPGSRLLRPLDAEDPRLLFDALRGAGAHLEWDADGITAGVREVVSGASLFLGNNGTGMRFLLAQLAAWPGDWLLDGVARLRERPVAALVRSLERLGASIEVATSSRTGSGAPQLPLRVFGRELAGGEVELDPSASSQFVSALLLLGARLPRGLTLRLAEEPPSQPYIDLTIDVLRTFGAECTLEVGGRELRVRGPMRAAAFEVEGDWSAAAFPLAAAAAAGGEVEVKGVRAESRQGDARVADLLAEFGCTVRSTADGVALTGPLERPLVADLRDTPDLFPALAVVVAAFGGRLSGLEGLAAKESDRVKVMAQALAALGFEIVLSPGRFEATGASDPVLPLRDFDPAGDHRIAMALAVAGLLVPGVRVADPGCVAKSWPTFWDDWCGLVAKAG